MLNTFIQKHFQVWWLQVLYMIYNAGCIALLYLHFVKNNVDFGYIFLAEALGYLAAVIFLLAKRSFTSRRDLAFGLVFVTLGLCAIFLPYNILILLFFYIIFKTIGAILFFTPYNILFFSSTQKEKKMQKMTAYWAIGGSVGVIAPALGGYIFSVYDLKGLLSFGLLMVFLALLCTRFVNQETHRYTQKDIWTHIRSLRLVTMIEGATLKSSSLIIALYLLTYVQDEFDLGKLLSVIALISILFSLQVGKFSDKYKKRFILIWPLSLAIAGIMLAFYLVNDFYHVVILIVIFHFLNTLINPLRSNIVVDAIGNTPNMWISRELFLNIGRVIILAIIAPFLFWGDIKTGFLIVALLYVILPYLVWKERCYDGE